MHLSQHLKEKLIFNSWHLFFFSSNYLSSFPSHFIFPFWFSFPQKKLLYSANLFERDISFTWVVFSFINFFVLVWFDFGFFLNYHNYMVLIYRSRVWEGERLYGRNAHLCILWLFLWSDLQCHFSLFLSILWCWWPVRFLNLSFMFFVFLFCFFSSLFGFRQSLILFLLAPLLSFLYCMSFSPLYCIISCDC